MAELNISDDDWNTPLDDEDLVEPPASKTWQNLQSASQGNPDTYAKDLDLAKKTGVPVQAISSNRDEIAKRDAVSMIKESDWNAPLDLVPNPDTAAYLENPDAAQISFDDIDVLAGLEREAKRNWIEVDERIFEGLGDSMMIGMGKMYDQAAIAILNESKRGGDFDIMKFGQNPIGAAFRKLQDTTMLAMEGEEGTKAWNDEIEKRIEKHRQNLEFAESEIARLTPQGLTVAEEGARGGIQMVADMVPGLAVSVVTRGKFNPTLYYLTGKTYLDSYGSAIVAGKDNDTAKQYAAIDAVLEFATERLPTKRLEKIIGEAGKGGIKSSIKKWLVGEAAGEQIATLTQSLNAYAHELDDELASAKDLNEVLEIQGRRQAVTFISTLVGGGSMAGTIKGVDYLANRERRAMAKVMEKTNKRRGAEFEQERLDNMIYLAQASKTNERSAEMFEEFMSKPSGDQQVFMTAEGVSLLDNPPGYILEQMDGSGGTVSIPLATFLKDFANDEAKLELVRPHIKTSEGLSTQQELEEDNDSEYIKALLAKAAEAVETKTAADEIYEKVTAQLVATGRQSQATARQGAALIPAQVTTQYEYLKANGITNEDGSEITLEQIYADIGLEVVGPEVDIAAEFMTQTESEYDQAVARGLPMDQISRLTRAKEMGFNIEQPMYHFTAGAEDFSEFRTLQHFGTQAAAYDRAAFVRAEPTYEIEQNNEGIYEVIDAWGTVHASADTREVAVQMENELARKDVTMPLDDETDSEYFGARTMPVYLNVQNPLRIVDIGGGHDAYALAEAMIATGKFTAQEINAQSVRDNLPTRNDIVELMESKGYDGFIYENVIEDVGQDSIISLRPEQIRSTQAAFDPDFSASPRVLAQQNFGNIQLTETVITEDGEVLEVTESAQSLWQVQQKRLSSLEALRNCING